MSINADLCSKLVELTPAESLAYNANKNTKKNSCTLVKLYKFLSLNNPTLFPNGIYDENTSMEVSAEKIGIWFLANQELLSGMLELDLSNSSRPSEEMNEIGKITEIPPQVWLFKNVASIDLFGQSLTSLSACFKAFSYFPNLKKLDLQNAFNANQSSPTQHERIILPSLEVLDLGHNSAQSILRLPKIIMPNLKTLVCSHVFDRYTSKGLPNNLFKFLSINYTTLEKLDLSYSLISNIEDIKPELCPNLKTLGLTSCEITDVDPSFSRFSNLDKLYLASNPICRNEEKMQQLQSYLPRTTIDTTNNNSSTYMTLGM